MHFKYKLILLIPLILLLNSCVTDYEMEEQDFNFYEYYTTNENYHYQISGTIEIAESPSAIDFKVGQSWSYINYSEYDIDPTDIKEVKIAAIIDNNLIRFNLKNRNDYKMETYDVLVSSGAYTMSKAGSSAWNTTRVIDYLPIPHISQLNNDVLYIKMDDNSVCYSINDGIYSTRFGKITSNNGKEDILIEYNGSFNDSIAFTLNEYLTKRDACIQ